MTDPIPVSEAIDGLDSNASLGRRQEYKRMLLSEQYQAEISAALAEQLLYVERRSDNTTLITLRDQEGSVAGRIHDQGDKMLALSRQINDVEILAMLEMAKAKGWTNITPTGSPEFCARAAELARLHGFTGGPAMPENAITGGDATPGKELGFPVGATAAAQRWAGPLEAARQQLLQEYKVAQARFAEIPAVDLKKLEKELAAKHGGDEYKAAVQAFKNADAKVQAAGVVTKKRAESEKERARQQFLAAHAQALAAPAAASCLTKAQQHNQEREQLAPSITQIKIGIGEVEAWQREIAKGRDPEVEFTQAWKRRKVQPMQRWQDLAIAPVFEAEASRERARLQTEADSSASLKAQSRQEQAQREMAAQKMADFIEDQLNKAGLPVKQEEALREQHQYYLALADGCDEEEAWERAKKTKAPQ